ncbi:MAG: sulfur carrier protein ThiS adenylyltransferase ThiF [Syntrophomonadaceae bacterium]|nr:sulfur carrier protein ThiS adenylyltransferase ThiF [Syntrophomonadaceae bacterium]
MNDFERALVACLGRDRLTIIQSIRVGIAGAGGLGSNCAQFLVRSGFKKLKIVDFDVVDWTNLNRQFYFADQVGAKKVEALRQNLLRINPDLELELLDQKITQENAASLFADCQIVVEALDQVESKKLMVETYLNSGKLLVCASGLAGWGKSDDIVINRLKENFYLVGDLIREVGPADPAMAPRVSIAAAKEADVILAYVLNCLAEGGQNDEKNRHG